MLSALLDKGWDIAKEKAAGQFLTGGILHPFVLESSFQSSGNERRMSMSESNRNKNQNSWQELADQLGLPEEPQQGPAARQEPPAAEPAERAAPVTRQEARREEADDSFAWTPAPREREDAERGRPRQETREEPVFQPEDVQVEVFAETVVIQSESTADSASAQETESTLSEDENPSTRTAGRRRRRRRSGKKKEGTAEVPAAQEPGDQPQTGDSPPEMLTFTAPAEQPAQPAREESTNEPSRERGRNRGRGGRRRREEEPALTEEPAADEDEVQESGGAVGFEEDSDDEEVANYSNWSVPSWKDLIASLYRPER
jgi:hypothetical protein